MCTLINFQQEGLQNLDSSNLKLSLSPLHPCSIKSRAPVFKQVLAWAAAWLTRQNLENPVRLELRASKLCLIFDFHTKNIKKTGICCEGACESFKKAPGALALDQINPEQIKEEIRKLDGLFSYTSYGIQIKLPKDLFAFR